ncbi:MAG: DNA polymerase III subunit gamma/tau, partial [Arcobacteraceae bacterium]|nr:DNA polymerase III subunit gamma/tau [Arcobacteraceae bacterium]
ILSRTQHFRFKKIAPKNVLHHLIHILNLENISYENEALEILIRSGEGSLRDTLTLLDQAIIYSKGSVSTVAVTDMMGMIDPVFMEKLYEIILNNSDITEVLNKLDSYEAGQVIDEMVIYLKQRLLSRDIKYDSYIFDRFFRILGEAKQLLALNSDSGFVLILTLSKMQEATNLKTIDEVINEIKNMPTEMEQVISKPVKVITELKQGEPIQDIEEDIIEVPQDIKPNLYADVIAKIYDRNYDLGVCFENSFAFNSYNENILTIDSSASGDCRILLNKNFAYIRHFIEDVYGKDTQIEFNKLIIKKDLPL